jgi:mycofactocin glycosyltransferase
MLERIYRLSPRARLTGQHGVARLVCTYPLQRTDLNASGDALVGALDGVTPLHELAGPAGGERWFQAVDFLEGLVTAGYLEARYEVSRLDQFPQIEIIVPVLNNAAGVQRCLAALAAQHYPAERWSVTVVDDGSSPPLVPTLPADKPPGTRLLRTLRLSVNVGPASARNAALEQPGEQSAAPLVAFTDSDCVPEPEWLCTLASVLEDPGLAAAGGQVLGLPSSRWLAGYDGECSSLNLGSRGGAVGRSGDRYGYLPTCNLMVRREALSAVSGFTPRLRLGEDVDLSARLSARQWRLFYFPGGSVRHAYRDRLSSFMSRKAAYASTEGWLRRRHGGARRGGISWTPALALGVSGVGTFWGGLGAMIGLAAALTLLCAEAMVHVWRNRAAAQSQSIPEVLAATVRRSGALLIARCRFQAKQHAIFGAVALPIIVWYPGIVIWCGVVVAAAAWGEWTARRPALAPPVFVAGYLLDVLAYSYGRWKSLVCAILRGNVDPFR